MLPQRIEKSPTAWMVQINGFIVDARRLKREVQVEAYRKGLVNRVVPDAKVEEEAYTTARRIAEGAPLVNRWHKQFIERLTVSAQIPPQEWDEGFACFDTKDYKEGVAAFLAKRKPDFKGR